MKKVKFVLLSFVLIVALVAIGFGQKNKVKLIDKRITLDFEKTALGYIFRDLIENYDIAIGFEESTYDKYHNDYDYTPNLPSNSKLWKSDDGNVTVTVKGGVGFRPSEHWFTVKVKNETLENVLNSIVGQMKYYKWEINDDVVNIFPIDGRDKRYEQLLELRVAKFVFGNNEEIAFIRHGLFKLPEFREFLKENNLLYDSVYSSADGESLLRKLPNGLNFINLTFKELLNRIAKVKRGGWILKQHDMVSKPDREFIDINI